MRSAVKGEKGRRLDESGEEGGGGGICEGKVRNPFSPPLSSQFFTESEVKSHRGGRNKGRRLGEMGGLVLRRDGVAGPKRARRRTDSLYRV